MPLKLNKLAITVVLVSFTFLSYAQSVIIENGINLPQDTVLKKQLISSLNGFLAQKEQPNSDNKFVLKEDLLETSALLDEMKGMEGNSKAKDFFKAYLNNAVKLDENNFIIQLSYIGILDNAPLLRATFNLLAKKEDGKFYFSSPLKQNTAGWRIKKRNNVTFHFKDTLNIADAKVYQEMVNFYDKKLKSPDFPVEFYYCNNFPEVLQIIGIGYKADYNGSKNNNLTSHENNQNLMLNGWNSNLHRFDPHDLWHERLRTVMNGGLINRPVDEGCAYLYGGSWGGNPYIPPAGGRVKIGRSREGKNREEGG